jgi:hypothetical protein
MGVNWLRGLIKSTNRYHFASDFPSKKAFVEKFKMPSEQSDKQAEWGRGTFEGVALEVIEEWLEPEGYKVAKKEEIEADLAESGRDYTDLVVEKDVDMLYIIATNEPFKRKKQVALKTMFRLRKERLDKRLTVKINEQKRINSTNDLR